MVKAFAQKYNIMYDLAFSLEAFTPDGKDVTAGDIRLAVQRRLAALDDEELLEAVGFCDSYELGEEE